MIDLDDCPELRATARDKTWLYEAQMPLLLVAGALLCLATWRTKDLVSSEYMQVKFTGLAQIARLGPTL